LGLENELLDGRHGFCCLRWRGLFPVPAQICGFSAQVFTEERQAIIDYYSEYYS
jgi:hypothetical protein